MRSTNFARYRYATATGLRTITEWGVKQFEEAHGKRADITPRTHLCYVYAVLPTRRSREKYALNLKRGASASSAIPTTLRVGQVWASNSGLHVD